MTKRYLYSLYVCALVAACGPDAPSSGVGDGGGATSADGAADVLDVGATDARTDALSSHDAGRDASAWDGGGPHAPTFDAGPLPDFPDHWPRSRGWTWVRSNETFVSALTTNMGVPPAAAVDRYYDEFHANAAHTWMRGLPGAIDGWMAARPDGRWISWLVPTGDSGVNGMLIGGGAPAPGRIGYQVGDEPRTRAELDAIIAGLRRVRAADPSALLILNFTHHADDVRGFLRTACDSGVVDIIKYDHYTFDNRSFETLGAFRDAARDCGIPYWRYLKSYVADGGTESVQTESDMRWAAFVGLLYGYTGHSWFLYHIGGPDAVNIPTTLFDSTSDWDASPTPRFSIAAQINRELGAYGRAQTRLRSTGIGFVAARPITGLHPPPGAPSWSEGTGGDPYLALVTTTGGISGQDVLLGFFEDRFGDTYVMVMNPNRTHSLIVNRGDAPTTVRLGLDFTGASGVSRERVLVLRPTGTVEPVAIVDRAVSLHVAAGDVVFYKYDTGRPFEGY